MNDDEQKVRTPASLVNVQHWLFVESVQSAFVVHSCTTSEPEQVALSMTLHAATVATHVEVSVPFTQLGTLPPRRGTVAQQTGVVESHIDGARHSCPLFSPESCALPVPLSEGEPFVPLSSPF
jgi:hypothetical protein